MGQHLTPSCDVCGTNKEYRRGIGSFCPNMNCGGEATPETLASDAPPADGKFIQLSRKSVQIVLEEKLREQPTLSKVNTLDLFGVHADGSKHRLTHLLVQVSYPKPDRRPGPVRTTGSCQMHPKGVQLRLASRDGVEL